MAEIKNILFSSSSSHVSSLELTGFAQDEFPQHGAPCRIKIGRGNMPHGPFWESMGLLRAALEATPDSCPLRATEIQSGLIGNFPNYRGRHALTGGEDAVIENISRDNMLTVAAKALREMRALGLIGEMDCQRGLSMLLEQGLDPQAVRIQDHRDYKADNAAKPSHSAFGAQPSAVLESYLSSGRTRGVARPATAPVSPNF